MPASALPDVIDALITNMVAALPASTSVFDGFGVTGDPGDTYVLVGVDNPDANTIGFAAESQQEWANANYTARDESGEVVCAAVAWNGEGDQKAARDAAYGVLDAVAAMLKADPSLGVPELLWTSFGTRVQLSQDQNEKGANAIAVFRIHYRARI